MYSLYLKVRVPQGISYMRAYRSRVPSEEDVLQGSVLQEVARHVRALCHPKRTLYPDIVAKVFGIGYAGLTTKEVCDRAYDDLLHVPSDDVFVYIDLERMRVEVLYQNPRFRCHVFWVSGDMEKMSLAYYRASRGQAFNRTCFMEKLHETMAFVDLT